MFSDTFIEKTPKRHLSFKLKTPYTFCDKPFIIKKIEGEIQRRSMNFKYPFGFFDLFCAYMAKIVILTDFGGFT